MTDDEIMRYVQHIARSQRVLVKPLGAIVQLIAGAMQQHGIQPDEPRLENYLRRPAVQALLATSYEAALWRGGDGEFRLVALDLNPNPEAAARRLNYKRSSPNSCAFCQINEKIVAELRPETTRLNDIVVGSRVHPHCLRAMQQLRELAEQAET